MLLLLLLMPSIIALIIARILILILMLVPFANILELQRLLSIGPVCQLGILTAVLVALSLSLSPALSLVIGTIPAYTRTRTLPQSLL